MNNALTNTIIRFENYVSQNLEEKIDSQFFNNYLREAQITSTQTFSKSVIILYTSLNIVPVILFLISNNNLSDMTQSCIVLSVLILLIFIINIIFILRWYFKKVEISKPDNHE
mgnify:CR=1 FL=1